MKNLIIGCAALLVSCSPAIAEPIIRDHFKTVINKKPRTVEVCIDRHLSGDKTGDALRGAIIGGIIGNNVTKNLDNGGAVGALLGGMLGHSNSSASGSTKRVCKMETRYDESEITIYGYSTIQFTHEGKTYTLRFNK